MVYVIKKHKVTGEIVKVDGDKFAGLGGTIPAHIFAKISAATAAATDYEVVGQEGKKEINIALTEKEKELKDYCDHVDRMKKAMEE